MFIPMSVTTLTLIEHLDGLTEFRPVRETLDELLSKTAVCEPLFHDVCQLALVTSSEAWQHIHPWICIPEIALPGIPCVVHFLLLRPR